MEKKQKKNKGKKRIRNRKRNEKRNPRVTQTDRRDMQLLGDVSSTDPSVGISQRNVINVEAEISRDDFIRVAAVWPLFAIKNSVPNTLIDTEDYGFVGTMYLMYAGLVYDLYLATYNQVSMFTVMPRMYKELRDSLLPKVVGNTSYTWKKTERCFGTGGLVNILYPFVDFASLSWINSSGPLDSLYDFAVDGVITLTDDSVFNLCPAICQGVWTNLHKRVPIDLIAPSIKTGFEECVGPFSQPIDLSYVSNIGWIGSISEEIIPNSQYWTRFLGLVPFSSGPSTRTGVHVVNDYKGPHHYAGHVERYDYDDILGKNVKTLYRAKTISFEEIANYILTMAVESDLYGTEQSNSIDPSNVLPAQSVFNSMSEAQFLRYCLVLCFTRFTQEGWTLFALETCDTQTTLAAGINLTPYSDTYNIPVPRAVAEYFGSIGVKISAYRNGKSGYRLVNIPQLAVYGNTLANVYQNAAYSLSPLPNVASDLVPLLQAMNPQIIGTGPYSFNGTDATLPFFLNVNPLVTATSISLSQVSGTSVFDALQQVGDCFNTMKGYCTVSVNIANKDDVPFTVLYYTRIISEPEQSSGYSLIYLTPYSHLTNRVNFDQRTLGNHLGVPLPISCVPLPLHQVIYNEFSVTEVNNLAAFFKLTIRAAQSFVHPKESTSDTSDFELLNKNNTAQEKGGNFLKMLGGGLKMISPTAGKILGNFIPGGASIVRGLTSLIPDE